MTRKNEPKGYYSVQGDFYEYTDVNDLIVGEYVDIACNRSSGYWVDNNSRVSEIFKSTYDALVADGVNESESKMYTFENELNGQQICFEDAREIVVFKYVDIATGRDIGYRAEYNREIDISRSTYDALKNLGAGEGEDLLSFQNAINNKCVPIDDPGSIVLKKIKDVDSGHAGRYYAECDYGEFEICESTYSALVGAGASDVGDSE